MSEKLLLKITEDEISLYIQASQELSIAHKNIEDAQRELKSFLLRFPKTPLCLLVDRNHQDIREEKLPDLLPWDRLRLIFHKKEAWREEGGYVGYHFFNQTEGRYLRWIHIPPNDFLMPWMTWVKTLSQPFQGVFFVPLEAGVFLKKNLPLAPAYQMLLYPISSHKNRHVIFYEGRLLLSRIFEGEEDLNTSLHFLSRLHPHIHEKLYILSLIKDMPLGLPNIKVLPDSEALMRFLAAQKSPSLPFNPLSSLKDRWLRKGASIIFISGLIGAGTQVHKGLDFKEKALSFLPNIERLKAEAYDLNLLLKGKDVFFLHRAVDHYDYIKPLRVSPLKTLEKLAFLLNKHSLSLENLEWEKAETTKIILTFLLKIRDRKSLSKEFNSFLLSCSEIFPKSQIQVLEAPFNSGPQEIFKMPPETTLPRAQVRIILQ